MPVLEITECVSCPFSMIGGYDKNGDKVGEDMFFIECIHDDQSNEDGFEAKIKNKDRKIYFDCPLEKTEP